MRYMKNFIRILHKKYENMSQCTATTVEELWSVLERDAGKAMRSMSKNDWFRQLAEDVADYICDSADLKTLLQYYYDDQIALFKRFIYKELVEYAEYVLPNFNIEDNRAIVEVINKANPDLLWIGIWMYICYNSCKGGVWNVTSNFQKSESGIRMHRGNLTGIPNKRNQKIRVIQKF